MLRTYMRGIAAHRRGLRLIQAVGACAAIALTACQDISGPKENKETPVTGSYALADVGGNRLPITVYEGPFTVNGQRINVKLAVQSGTLQLNEGRYQMQLGVIATVQGQNVPLPFSDAGSYTKNGNQLAFKSDDPNAGAFAVSITNGALTFKIDMSGDGHPPTYQFRK